MKYAGFRRSKLVVKPCAAEEWETAGLIFNTTGGGHWQGCWHHRIYLYLSAFTPVVVTSWQNALKCFPGLHIRQGLRATGQADVSLHEAKWLGEPRSRAARGLRHSTI